MSDSMVRLDTSVPALLVRVGRYPLHAGSLGVVRSLGVLGVPVYAVVEDRLTPVGCSRLAAGRFVWPHSGDVDPAELVRRLVEIGRRLGRPTVAVATDDEAALLLAQHADELAEHFLLPRVPPALPTQLASKRGLAELCRKYGVPTPRTAFLGTPGQLAEVVAAFTFPVVVKNVAPWVRLRNPVVAGTTVVTSPGELLDRLGGRVDLSGALVQEHIPHAAGQDWFVHAYCDAGSALAVGFTGQKAYAWPPGRGVTADARPAPNPALIAMTAAFCRDTGYRGILDLDWRYDRRDGLPKLLDFNPRVGAQFRFGVTAAGVDVVRALHLDLTGRPVPAGSQDYTRRLVVETIYLPARLLHRRSRLPPGAPVPAGVRTHGAWAEGAWRDPVPLAVMLVRFAGSAGATVTREIAALLRRLWAVLLCRFARRSRRRPYFRCWR
ncbi:hypothetical protein [Actinoplanes sp. NPDC049681]|uniref:hypothetical protein n=1 Tax=Actinoplanes sp. NPDC049681 TaxID=3363905 RepID=UPI0037AF0002